MLTTVKLLGELGRKFGRSWELDINSPAEAIRAIAAQCREFASYLYESADDGVAYRVVSGDALGMSEAELSLPLPQPQLIIAPIIQGSGAVGRIVLGVALIGAAFLLPGGFLGLSATTLGITGAALILGGIASMLTPKPKNKDKKNDSYLFDRGADLGAQGNPVPILYGERIITGLIPLSSSIELESIPVGAQNQTPVTQGNVRQNLPLAGASPAAPVKSPAPRT